MATTTNSCAIDLSYLVREADWLSILYTLYQYKYMKIYLTFLFYDGQLDMMVHKNSGILTIYIHSYPIISRCSLNIKHRVNINSTFIV
jgi:hypothetical protein